MKNLKVNYSYFKDKITPILISFIMGSSVIGFSGCVPENEVDDDSVTYKVEKSEEQIKFEDDNNYLDNVALIDELNPLKKVDSYTASYDSFVDLDNIKGNYCIVRDLNGKVEDEQLEKENENKDFVYPVRTLNYTTSGLEGSDDGVSIVSADYFIDNSSIILPDSLFWAIGYIEDSQMYNNKAITGSFVGTINYTELNGINGNRYLLQESMLDVESDIDRSNVSFDSEKYGEQDNLKKGDFIYNATLYKINKDDSLIILANKQTGLGRDCKNVKASIVGDFDKIYQPISSIEDRESIEFSNVDEFEQFVYNGVKPKVKTK